MSALAIKLDDVVEPSVEEIEAAREAARRLLRVNRDQPIRITIDRSAAPDEEALEPIGIPANIFKVFVSMLVEMGNGNAVAMVPVTAELTTQQAADLLNVSRPHVIKLLNEDKIKYRLVGTHRKIRAQDVLTYKDLVDFDRRSALANLVEMDEGLGLYGDRGKGASES